METQYDVPKPSSFKTLVKDLVNENKNSDKDNLIILLEGDLGAGKTTFTQQLGEYLGIKEIITSPTFTIQKIYPLEHPDFDQMVHIDAYRIESQDEVGPLRIEETLKMPRTIVCIEWPKNISDVIPSNAKKLQISIVEGDNRTVMIAD